MKSGILHDFLKGFLTLTTSQQTLLVKNLNDDQLKSMVEIVYNILQGVCSISKFEKENLRTYKSSLRALTSKRIPRGKRRRLLLKTKSIIPILIKVYLRYSKKTI